LPDGVVADCASAGARAETVAASTWNRCCRRRDAADAEVAVALRRAPRCQAMQCAALKLCGCAAGAEVEGPVVHEREVTSAPRRDRKRSGGSGKRERCRRI